MSFEGAICIGTNLDNEQTPLITVLCVLHPSSGLNTSFLAQNAVKLALKSSLFTCFSGFTFLAVFDCHG